MPTPTAARAVEIAESQVGTTENPPGSNSVKYNRWYYGSDARYPWCATFVSWVLAKAGFPPDAYKHAYTPYGVDLFKKLGAWTQGTSGVRAGDVVYFDFPDSVYRVQHVGIATGPVKNGQVPTIEGNTSAGASGSQDNGGGVFKRTRPTAHIVGYGRPAYEVDYDYVVTVVMQKRTKKFRYERLRMAMQKARAAVTKGRKAKIKRVRG